MIGLLGRQGPGATLRQHCPQMTQRRCNTSSKTSFNCRLDHSLMTSCECYTFWTPSPLVTFPCTQIHEACQGPPHYSENTVFASLENFLPKSKGWPLPASLPKSAFHSKTLYLTESKERGWGNRSCKKMPHPSSPLWIAFILGRPIHFTTEGQ